MFSLFRSCGFDLEGGVRQHKTPEETTATQTTITPSLDWQIASHLGDLKSKKAKSMRMI
jgi:hypothetical protein